MSTLNFKQRKRRTKKTKICKIGYNCGNSCINKNLNCKRKFSGQASTYASWLKLQAGNTSKQTNSLDKDPATLKIGNNYFTIDSAINKRNETIEGNMYIGENEDNRGFYPFITRNGILMIREPVLLGARTLLSDSEEQVFAKHGKLVDRNQKKLIAHIKKAKLII